MTENQIKFIEFIKDNKQRQITIKEELFHKITFNHFDFIYILNYLRHGYPSFRDEAKLTGIKDTATNKFYFMDYYTYRIFDTQEQASEILNNITEETIIKAYNDDIIKALKEIESKTKNDRLPEDNDLHSARSNAEREYFYSKERDEWATGTSSKRELCDILEYITNPEAKIKKDIEQLEASDYENRRPSYIAKYNLMMNELTNKALNIIKTAPQYEALRQAKTIKDSIPQDAKQINLIYLLNNGEILKGKILADAFNTLPFCSNVQNAHISSYSTDPATRQTLKEINGRSDDDIKYSNIIALTYKGKAFYINPEHADKMEG